MSHPNGFPTLAELRTMPEEKLIQEIDHLYAYGAENRDHRLLIDMLHGELLRRPQERATGQMICLTWMIAVLTFFLVLGLVVQIYLAVK